MVKNILIVDDKLENRYMIEALLRGEDFTFSSVSNGVEALDIAHQSPPDLVISDILMPVMDGFTLCKEWRSDKMLKNIPFIFYTAAYTNPKDIRYALKLGADRFLIKPQEPDEFLNEIKQVLHEFESGQLKPSPDSVKNELESMREYNSILFRKLEDKLFQIELDDRKLKRYSFELDQYLSALKKAEKNLLYASRMLDNLAEFYQLPYLICDEKFSIEKFNHRFELISGFEEREMKGKNISFLFQEINEKSQEELTGESLQSLETRFQKKNGEEKNITLNFSWLKNQENEPMLAITGLTAEMIPSASEDQQPSFLQDQLERKIKDRTLELENSREQLRGLSSHLQEIREEERKHVAREIHDELGHLLTALKIDLEGLYNSSSVNDLKTKVLPLINIVDAAIDSIKTIATELRPAILDNFGLIAALEWLIQQLRIRTKIECEVEFDTLDYQFTNEESTAVFRIFQEILTNVSRHSKATHLWVSFKKENHSLILNVKDDGIGFDLDKVSRLRSFGLLGMSEWAHSIGGELSIRSIKELGTTVNLVFKEKRKTNDKNSGS